MVFVTDLARKGIDHLGIGDVLLLGSDRQLQVVAHQPRNESRIIRRQSLLQAERLGIHATQLGMIAAASFGNVMEEGGEIGDLGPRQTTA